MVHGRLPPKVGRVAARLRLSARSAAVHCCTHRQHNARRSRCRRCCNRRQHGARGCAGVGHPIAPPGSSRPRASWKGGPAGRNRAAGSDAPNRGSLRMMCRRRYRLPITCQGWRRCAADRSTRGCMHGTVGAGLCTAILRRAAPPFPGCRSQPGNLTSSRDAGENSGIARRVKIGRPSGRPRSGDGSLARPIRERSRRGG